MSSPSVAKPGPPRPYRFSVDQYHRMSEIGIIPEDLQVELVDGRIILRDQPGSRHAPAASRLPRIFSPLKGRAVLRSQAPLSLGNKDEPVPDFALVRAGEGGDPSAYPSAKDAQLLIEVSDTTLEFDREWKGRVYALHGVYEFWIVNLAARTIEIRRRPVDDGWDRINIFRPGVSIAPRAFPDFSVNVDDLLP